MPYTFDDAEREIGKSTSWEDARAPSLKKWEQIAGGDEVSYGRFVHCGFCIVLDNRGECCYECPAILICDEACIDADPEVILKMLRELE